MYLQILRKCLHFVLIFSILSLHAEPASAMQGGAGVGEGEFVSHSRSAGSSDEEGSSSARATADTRHPMQIYVEENQVYYTMLPLSVAKDVHRLLDFFQYNPHHQSAAVVRTPPRVAGTFSWDNVEVVLRVLDLHTFAEYIQLPTRKQRLMQGLLAVGYTGSLIGLTNVLSLVTFDVFHIPRDGVGEAIPLFASLALEALIFPRMGWNRGYHLSIPLFIKRIAGFFGCFCNTATKKGLVLGAGPEDDIEPRLIQKSWVEYSLKVAAGIAAGVQAAIPVAVYLDEATGGPVTAGSTILSFFMFVPLMDMYMTSAMETVRGILRERYWERGHFMIRTLMRGRLNIFVRRLSEKGNVQKGAHAVHFPRFSDKLVPVVFRLLQHSHLRSRDDFEGRERKRKLLLGAIENELRDADGRRYDVTEAILKILKRGLRGDVRSQQKRMFLEGRARETLQALQDAVRQELSTVSHRAFHVYFGLLDQFTKTERSHLEGLFNATLNDWSHNQLVTALRNEIVSSGARIGNVQAAYVQALPYTIRHHMNIGEGTILSEAELLSPLEDYLAEDHTPLEKLKLMLKLFSSVCDAKVSPLFIDGYDVPKADVVTIPEAMGQFSAEGIRGQYEDLLADKVESQGHDDEGLIRKIQLLRDYLIRIRVLKTEPFAINHITGHLSLVEQFLELRYADITNPEVNYEAVDIGSWELMSYVNRHVVSLQSRGQHFLQVQHFLQEMLGDIQKAKEMPGDREVVRFFHTDLLYQPRQYLFGSSTLMLNAANMGGGVDMDPRLHVDRPDARESVTYQNPAAVDEESLLTDNVVDRAPYYAVSTDVEMEPLTPQEERDQAVETVARARADMDAAEGRTSWWGKVTLGASWVLTGAGWITNTYVFKYAIQQTSSSVFGVDFDDETLTTISTVLGVVLSATESLNFSTVRSRLYAMKDFFSRTGSFWIKRRVATTFSAGFAFAFSLITVFVAEDQMKDVITAPVLRDAIIALGGVKAFLFLLDVADKQLQGTITDYYTRGVNENSSLDAKRAFIESIAGRWGELLDGAQMSVIANIEHLTTSHNQ